MTDPSRDSASEPSGYPGAREGPPGPPRWVIVAGIIVAALVLAALVVVFLTGGQHGPNRHAAGESAIEPNTHATAGTEVPSGDDGFVRDHR